jgi:hypothetical protein
MVPHAVLAEFRDEVLIIRQHLEVFRGEHHPNVRVFAPRLIEEDRLTDRIRYRRVIGDERAAQIASATQLTVNLYTLCIVIAPVDAYTSASSQTLTVFSTWRTSGHSTSSSYYHGRSSWHSVAPTL